LRRLVIVEACVEVYECECAGDCKIEEKIEVEMKE
jgi:hypothetical protein